MAATEIKLSKRRSRSSGISLNADSDFGTMQHFGGIGGSGGDGGGGGGDAGNDPDAGADGNRDGNTGGEENRRRA